MVRLGERLAQVVDHAPRRTTPGAGCDARQDELVDDARTGSPYRLGRILVLEPPRSHPERS
jgi:hypothetical protein